MLFEDDAMNELVDALDDVNALLRECSRIDGLARPLNERTVDLVGQVIDWLHTTPRPGEIASTRDNVRALRAEVEEFVAT